MKIIIKKIEVYVRTVTILKEKIYNSNNKEKIQDVSSVKQTNNTTKRKKNLLNL